ncbi:MAG: DUF1284 domain-containing protein [Hespellia sp.]|nr:DUF1284 domain-containing protein [Hespellia sp.]
MDQKEIRLRGHHLICTGLFVGEGYSDRFSGNMSRVIRTMKEENPVVELVSSPDHICRACPKLEAQQEEGKSCKLDEVAKKDEYLLHLLAFRPGYKDTYRNIIGAVKDRITEEIFLECCGKCSWLEKGLCSYEKYLEGLK